MVGPIETAPLNHCYAGDTRVTLKLLADCGVQACVTSPPYYGLRSYLPDAHPYKNLEIGMEATPEEYVAALVEVFREVRRVLCDDGTLWLNLGDSYAGYHGNKNAAYDKAPSNKNGYFEGQRKSTVGMGVLKSKDLIGIPWRVAFALQADGWYLRQDIIWHKPNPMPESVRDRCTKAHEYLFLLSKSPRYYFDQKAIAQPITQSSVARLSQDIDNQIGTTRANGGRKTNGNLKAQGPRFGGDKYGDDSSDQSRTKSGDEWTGNTGTCNKRSVWTVTTKPFSGAHFATFPPELIEPCILAGTRPGQIVLDPFFGSGTTGEVAQRLGRRWIGCELNPEYSHLQNERTRQNGFAMETME